LETIIEKVRDEMRSFYANEAKKSGIEVFSAPTPNGLKITWMLEELGIPYTYNHIDLSQNVQKTSRFLLVNPNGRIPAIVDHDNDHFNCFESGAILIYLADKYKKFLPSDINKRSQVIQWLMFQMSGVGPMQGQANFFMFMAPEKIPFAINRYMDETKRLYSILDGQLADRTYLVDGDEPTIADFATYPWVARVERLKLSLESYPNLARWAKLLDARPGWKKGVAAGAVPYNPEVINPASLPAPTTDKPYTPETLHPGSIFVLPKVR